MNTGIATMGSVIEYLVNCVCMILAEDGKNDDILCRDGDCRLELE